MEDDVVSALRRDYGLADAEATLVGQGQAQNAVYRVASGGKRWFAKRYGPIYAERAAWVAFEVRLLSHLKAAGLPVAASVPTAAGAPFAWVDGRPLVLFEWAEGGVRWPAAPEEAGRLGAALAAMHLASDDLPLDGTERRFDLDRLIDAPLRHLLPFVAERPELGEGLRTYAERLRERARAVPPSGGAFGPIHGDVHQGNCFFEGDGLVVFDFALSGVGYRTYDLTGFLWPMRDATIDDLAMRECCDGFLAGYDRVRPLLPEERVAIPAFVQIRSLWEFGDWVECGDGAQKPDEIVKGFETFLRQLDAKAGEI